MSTRKSKGRMAWPACSLGGTGVISRLMENEVGGWVRWGVGGWGRHRCQGLCEEISSGRILWEVCSVPLRAGLVVVCIVSFAPITHTHADSLLQQRDPGSVTRRVEQVTNITAIGPAVLTQPL